jgi:Ca2+-binding EF-hand superfamily protein
MGAGKKFTEEEAKRIGDEIGIDWDEVELSEFLTGLGVEMEHGSHDPETNVTDDDEILTGKIALAHLREFPDYYTRLEKLEAEADEYWGNTGS